MTAASPHPPVVAPAAPAGRRWVTGLPTLAETFDPRHNSLNVLRLVLAGTVAVVHAMVNGFGHQPQLGSATLGDLAVDGFFVISGFLVTMSYLRLASFRRYAWHRFLRIMPGFWACLLVTAVLVAPLAAVLSGHPATSVLKGPESALSYVADNALLMMRQFGVTGIADPITGKPAVMDGSLWTLFYEAACYVAVVGFGVLGVLRRRTWLVLVACLVLWVATVVSATGVDLGSTLMLRFLFIFMLGAAAYLFADRLPISGLLATVSVALVALGLYLLPDYRALAGPAFAYLMMWATVRFPLRQNPRWDLSYGLYVYHWPIQLLLALAGVAVIGTVPFVILSVLLACVAAAGSWLLVESRALRLKNAKWVERPLPRVGRSRVSRLPD